MLRVRVLGDLEVERDGVPLALGGPKPRRLVGLLVAAHGRTVATERIIDQLWGDEPPPKVLTALHVYVAKLRRELEPDRDPRGRPGVLVTRPSGYALVLPDGAVDADRFERLAAADDEGSLQQALALWRGPAYAGLGDAPALAAEAVRLEELRLGAVEQLEAARVDRGAHEDAVGALAALVAEHPTRERLWALLVLALYRCGRQSDALDALRRVRGHLAGELGIDPGPELRALEDAVLRQDDDLLRAPARPGAAAAAPAAQPAEELVVRGDLLARTRLLVEAAASGAGRLLLVTGEPGIGKTRLAAAVAAQAAAAGLRPVEGGWEAEGCPPLEGWTRALGADLAGAAGPAEDTASATFRRAGRVLERLTAGRGTCLVLDDVQWADPDSLRLLGRVAGTLAAAPVLLVVLCREPVGEGSPALAALFGTLARLGAERIALTGLDGDEVRALVRQRAGLDIPAAVAERVRERTDGNPFYAHELVRLLAEEGALADAGSPAWRLVPHGVRDTVRHRLAELPPAVRDAVTAVAVLGRVVDLDVLEAYWSEDVGLLDEALDAALAAGLLTADADRVAFPHALVRDAVYGDLPPLARRRMHARAAATVERVRVGALDAHAVALAEHYRLAGPAHTRSAWTYAARAARAAAATGASSDAARLLESAAVLQAGDELAVPQEREELHVAWGTALRRSGRIAEAWPPLRVAAESALERGDPPAAARALLAVTEQVLWSWRTAHVADEDAVALWQRVLAALPRREEGLRARCLAALAVEVMHDPPGGRCAAWADEALELARRQGDLAVRADVLHVVVNALRRPDLVPRRLPAADELVELCARSGDERSLAVALCKRALDHSGSARPDAALADLQRALVLAERHAVAPALMVVHLGRAVLFSAAGEWAASEEELQAAEAVQTTLAMAGSGIGGAVRATALLVQGRFAEAEPAVAEAERVHPSFLDLRALLLVREGRVGEARALLGPWREQAPVTWDYLWVSGTVLRALLWSELGDADAVADLRRQLEPFADRVADGAMAACFLGSVRHALAALALAAGDLDAARERAQQARDLHRRLGWAPWERESQRLLDRI